MRFIHTSDWHLGRTLHGEDLFDAHQKFLDWLVSQVQEHAVDAVLISGDVFDQAYAPARSIEQFSDALARLAEHACVIATPGNHDSAVRLGYLSPLLRDQVTIISRTADAGRGVRVAGRDGHDAVIYPLPYLDPSDARRVLAEEFDGEGVPIPLARSHEAVTSAAMRRIRTDIDERRIAGSEPFATIVMAHAFVIGGQASDSERDIRVGGVDSVPSGVFSDVDYVALGHLHGPQQIGAPAVSEGRAPVIRYSGSPLAFSFSEMNHHKSVCLVEVTARDGVTACTVLATPIARRLSHIEGTLEEVLSAVHADKRDDWVRIVLTDARTPAGYLSVIKQAFPHMLQVQRKPVHSADSPGAATITESSDPTNVVADFVRYVTTADPTDDEMALIRSIISEVDAAQRSA